MAAAADGPGGAALAPRLEGAGQRVRTKWPNDVVALPEETSTCAVADVPGWGPSRKVSGVLCELVPGADRVDGHSGGADGSRDGAEAARAAMPAVIVGIGVNLAQGAADLPVPWAASLVGLGADPGLAAADDVLRDLGKHLAGLVARWEEQDGDPDGGDGGLGRDLREACSTLGRDVVVTVPMGPAGSPSRVRGRAVDLRPGLVLRDAVGGPAGDGAEEFVVSAGDVTSARFGA